MGRLYSTAGDNTAVSGYTAIDGITTLTIANWFNFRSLGGSNFGTWLVKGDGTTYEWACFISSGQVNFQASSWGTSVGQWWINATALGLSFSTPYHIAITYDYGSTANDPIIYLNAGSATVTEATTPSGSRAGSVGGLIIGNNKTSGGTVTWDGWVEEVGIWNRILTPQEIRTTYHAGPLRVGGTGLVAYLPDLGDYSPEPNYAPQGNATRNGTVTGTSITNNFGTAGGSRSWGYNLEAAGGTLGGTSTQRRSFCASLIG